MALTSSDGDILFASSVIGRITLLSALIPVISTAISVFLLGHATGQCIEQSFISLLCEVTRNLGTIFSKNNKN